MTSKSGHARQRTKLTDAQRHARFTAMAKEVGASDDPKDFEKAFDKVAKPQPHTASSDGPRKR